MQKDYYDRLEEVRKDLNKENTIIITSNGFDLQCGLKSHYSDFLIGVLNPLQILNI